MLAHLIKHGGNRQLLQILQVRVEQVCVCQSHLQQRLNDVAYGAVIRKADLFCCADKIPQTEITRSSTRFQEHCCFSSTHLQMSVVLCDRATASYWMCRHLGRDSCSTV